MNACTCYYDALLNRTVRCDLCKKLNAECDKKMAISTMDSSFDGKDTPETRFLVKCSRQLVRDIARIMFHHERKKYKKPQETLSNIYAALNTFLDTHGIIDFYYLENPSNGRVDMVASKSTNPYSVNFCKKSEYKKNPEIVTINGKKFKKVVGYVPVQEDD